VTNFSHLVQQSLYIKLPDCLMSHSIQSSGGPQRSETRNRGARRVGVSAPATVGRRGRRSKATSGSRRRTNSANGGDQGLRKMKYWQKHHRPWYDVLQCLRKAEATREWKQPWRDITDVDSARWFQEAKEWYEEDKGPLVPTGQFKFFLH
jgi:hypothetical protein